MSEAQSVSPPSIPTSIPEVAPSAPAIGENIPGFNMQYLSHIQNVLKTYPLSFVQVSCLIFAIISIILLYFFQEQVKSCLRAFVRKILYRTHVNADGTKVETHSRAATDGIYQMLTYLEQTWLAPADRSTMETLPANVELDERYSVAIPPPEGEDKQDDVVEETNPIDDEGIIDQTRLIVRDL